MPEELTFRRATITDVPLFENWYKEAGWNPGQGDIALCQSLPGNYFAVGMLDDEIISTLAITVYSGSYAFGGYYMISNPTMRGHGYGMETPQHILNTMHGQGVKIIGQDCVQDQIENYKKIGFESQYLHQRHRYRVTGVEASAPEVIHQRPLPQLLTELDGRYVPEQRPDFISAWLDENSPRQHVCLVKNNEVLTGYATCRPAAKGYRIGPLYARNSDDARLMFQALCSELPPGTDVFIDIPDANTRRFELINALSLEYLGIDCMRMYKGNPLPISVNDIFGVCTIEMG